MIQNHRNLTFDTGTIAEYRVQRFRGSSYFPSPYKGPPTDAVEDAWAALWDIGAIQISEEEFSHVNASPHAVEVPPELGGGRMAMLEVNHQIHCLHMLWQHSYPDYYQEAYNYSIEKPEHWHEHMDHCADMLRQQLMCSADNTVVTYNWLKGHYAPQPNFNAVHRCGNFDAVLAWGKTRVIDGTALSGKDYWTRPERYVEFERIPYEPNEAGDQFPVD
ncbi:uncharacterized protein LY89DRAFT_645897 [Mollisia scopiformis]|uniref:Uncharacterized protein n=1 Tax=Mollisia scopiformis TaxID=149040 RepID=A0A194X9Q0_MOLSC|nr:uncharacterized protein LY89DRAFT_645897 [Mollisia scopiformis]KUJ16888.1 hypothetical protein LY89DRAFT_645897 [Mollisia scopiformis]